VAAVGHGPTYPSGTTMKGRPALVGLRPLPGRASPAPTVM